MLAQVVGSGMVVTAKCVLKQSLLVLVSFTSLANGSFGMQQVISTDASGAVSVHAADLDGDGDNDVLSDGPSMGP